MPVELTFRDECAILTLNRPEALNALSFAILGEIGAAIDQAATSSARPNRHRGRTQSLLRRRRRKGTRRT